MKKYTILLYLFFHVLFLIKPVIPVYGQSTVLSVSATGDIKQDSLALVALYHSTNGDDWFNNDNWLSNRPIQNWHGVKVSDERVIELDLHWNNLNGFIPSRIGNLTYLSNLNLYHNKLSGPIPNEIGNLTRLFYLALYENRLNGIIPSEIGNLTNLIFLKLNENLITGPIPPEIGNLKMLSYINMNHNELTGAIPSEIGYLTNIYYLDLYGNKLGGAIPQEIGNLTYLSRLALDSNMLTGAIPAELGNLTNLEYLDLHNNKINGSIPIELSQLTSLRSLILYGNQLTGSIPNELGSLSKLDCLDLRGNKLSGTIPSELGSLTKLHRLYLNNNQLTGTIPNELGTLSNLYWLELANNRLTGSFPTEIIYLTNLYWIDFSYNQLTGSVPPEIGGMKRLYYLNLSKNKFIGFHPKEISDLTNLNYLNLNNNRLEELPNLSSFTRLNEALVSNNFLTYEDIEPNVGIRYFRYSPQAKIGKAKKMRISFGDTLIINGETGGSANLYQWYKDEKAIQGAESPKLNLLVKCPDGIGTYYVKVSNNIATKLVLQSKDIKIIEKLENEEVIRAVSDTVVFAQFNSNSSIVTVEFNGSSSVSVMPITGNTTGKSISITQISVLPDFTNAPVLDNILHYYNIETSASSLEAEITFGYTDEMLEDTNITESELAANYYNEKTLMWVTVPGELDTVNNTLSVNTDHFSIWCIGEAQKGIEIDYDTEPVLPEKFQLGQNYPNPFNSGTQINYHLPEAVHVTLTVYNVLGQEVIRLVDTDMPAGFHTVKWDASNVSSGTYIYRIAAGGFTFAKKMMVIR
ncbi:T9SS type A sorting domain-containing protein [candidate division KSB1 bacterium]